ncbi:MAG: sensor histidine kinase [Hyphomonadaceae bacterium]|nr:sensor histidine kinase [Hyphomonadaceae bacterium]
MMRATRQGLKKSWLNFDSPWPWLVYLALLFWPWANRPMRPSDAVVAFGAITIFLPLYFYGFRRTGRGGLAAAIAIAGLGFLTCLSLPSASVFLTYAGSMLGWRRPERQALIGLGALSIVTALFSWVTSQPFYFWMPALFFPAMIGLSTVMGARLREKNVALEAAQLEARRLAALAERERIARDMHDLLGHTLTLISVKADLASRLLPLDPGRADAELRDIQDTARRALAEVRQALSDMKQAGLGAELAHARAALAAVDVRLELEGPIPPTPEHLERPLALLIREGVTNVVRHANASVCRISLARDAGALRLIIADDGRGGPLRQGNGLAGMRARVQEQGGALALDTRAGVRIEATFPLEGGAEA